MIWFLLQAIMSEYPTKVFRVLNNFCVKSFNVRSKYITKEKFPNHGRIYFAKVKKIKSKIFKFYKTGLIIIGKNNTITKIKSKSENSKNIL